MGPKQVRVLFNKLDQGFLHRLWWGAGMMPQAYRESVGEDEFAHKPVGTGPFKWVDYKQDQWIKLEAVDKHFQKTPQVKTLRIVFVPEPSTRLAMLKAGEADMADLIGAHAQQIRPDTRRALKRNFLPWPPISMPIPWPRLCPRLASRSG